MVGQPGFFDVDERLKDISAKGDDLERLKQIVDFEVFRADLERAAPRSDRSKGGRPPYDHILMFKVLILQASHSLSDERTEYLIKDRLSFMRFLGLTLADRVPDANSIWNFREALTRTIVDGKPAIEVLFKRFDAALAQAGFLAMGGQIVDATIVAAPKQRNTEAEKKAIKEGCIPEDCDRKRWGDRSLIFLAERSGLPVRLHLRRTRRRCASTGATARATAEEVTQPARPAGRVRVIS